ncbi:MAG: OmpA family protein [Cyclobacteriaceae bacterium]|jgi:outer membrane protein OmpA-like peptidoglycan-associated protein/tetratricopeptide (TPR) repeat protein|nr:OmpA family protein [Cyclobacteriaceae bacterium]
MRFITLLFVFALLAMACGTEKKATKAFQLGKYQTAIDLYSKLLADNPQNGYYNYMVAESYRLSNRLKDAEPYYTNAGGRGVNRDTVRFFYAQSLKSNGKYQEARRELDELIKNTTAQALKERASAELEGLTYLEKLNSSANYYRVRNLELINTPAAEYAPVYLNNELYFSSNRGNGKIYEATGTPYSDLYKVATRGANVDVATVQPLPSHINDPIRNEGCVTFTPDGRIMVFAKGNTSKKNGGEDVDLYLARWRNGEWSEPTKINAPVNVQYRGENAVELDRNFGWDSTPAFSPDGRTLYFASNRQDRNAQGGTDLYSAQMDSRGRFTRVRNLGPEINTPGNEMFPYVSEDGRLYFASDGHPGYGGLDLFVVNRRDGKNTIENLGQPMNSPGDDFGIFLFRADRGFFTSNREGGKGDDDIYTFVNEDPNLKVINYALQGITYFKDKDENLQVLPNTRVTLLDSQGEAMQDYVTGNDGKFLFRVYENEDYNLVAESEGYLTKRQAWTMKGKGVDPSTLKDLVTNITLDTIVILDRKAVNEKFVLENIYFGFDSTDIKPEAAIELDKLAQLLIDNPEIKIEMGSHTDSVGSFDYNIDLSRRRAESTVRYLINKGISPERLTAKGYGETQPIARNTNPDGTDNPLGRAKNRRTEFKILEVGVLPRTIQEEAGEVYEYEEDKYFRD